jgi:hypothetical protein
MANNPKAVFIKPRKLLVSFVPPNGEAGVSAKQWVDDFILAIEKYQEQDEDTVMLLNGEAGDHVDYRNDAGWTDLIVICTDNVAAKPPDEIKERIMDIQIGSEDHHLVWAAIYDACDFQRIKLKKLYDSWHVLTGQGHGGRRLKTQDDDNYKDDLDDAACHITDHKTCESSSPICPKNPSHTLP